MTIPTRVRFAPSPTGYLHIGGVRTALFNWLFARGTNGTFILRIEDTDEKRSTDESLHAILDGLAWLGLDWDEGPLFGQDGSIIQKGGCGPYFQMERLDHYNEWLRRLAAMGRAYPCWCAKEELDRVRADALARKEIVRYNGRCRNVSEGERTKRLAEHLPHVWRFKIRDDERIEFTDVIHGHKEFCADQLDDFVLMKSTGGPTYNFACVVDDHLMGITHVIRGDDHLSNTPRQVLLYRVLGIPVPVFAHLPMIMGPDGSRLSKRHGATSLGEYAASGFLKEALINYLALLGWSTSDSQQVFAQEELIRKFSLERCSKSSAIFDPQKLSWMNGEYVRAMPVKELTERSMPFLKNQGIYCEDKKAYCEKVMALVHEKFKRLDEVPGLVRFLLTDTVDYDPAAAVQWLNTDETYTMLHDLRSVFEHLEDFSSPAIEQAVRVFAKNKGLKTPQVFHPLRVAVSGRTQGPSLFDMLSLLGKQKVLQRMAQVHTTTGGET